MLSSYLGRKVLAVTLAATILGLTPAPAFGGTARVIGWLDSITVEDQSATVVGWAADPDADIAAGVHIYVNGQFTTGGPANLRRPDVDRATNLGEYHGFRFEVALGSGDQKICVFALDRTGDANRLLGCHTTSGGLTAPTPVAEPIPSGESGNTPKGWLDSATTVESGIQVRGWALDPDTTASITIHVYVNGKFKTGFLANVPRPDVGRAFGLGDNHGFNRTLDLSPGFNTVCLFGIDKTGDKNSLIECTDTVIPFTDGSVVTASGVVLPIIETNTDSWTVQTPCTNVGEIAFGKATLVTQVDVVLDPGHGGSETGSSANGLVEKTLNLDITRRVRSLLEANGYSVLVTRDADHRLPLVSRGAIANSVHAKAFVSIHHNGGATNRAGHPGTMTLYQHDLAESRRLGMLLWQEMYDTAREHPTSWVSNSLTGASSRLSNVSNDRDYYGVHRYTPDIPSVITEWGYITNSYEASQLKTNTVKQAEAQAIAGAIIKWFETADQGAGDIGTWKAPDGASTGGTSGCVDPALP